MSVQTIDAALLSRMFLAGAQNLDAKKEWINELNVFPVPDGDTGTNMTMTITAAAKEVQSLADVNMKDLCKAIANGSLRGARGNSGVILSQLFRGFTKTVRAEEEIDVQKIAAACEKAVETAYKAVIKPKEGTILTVAKGMADIAVQLKDAQLPLEEYIRNIIDYGNEVLAKTPDMLPVLKEAGVVDSGGQGLMTVLEGAYDALMGKEINTDFAKPEVQVKTSAVESDAEEEIKFGYCTEFIINIDNELTGSEVEELRNFLLGMGDSLVLVPDTDLVKIHVHTNEPGVVITKALTYGSLTNMKIDNMRVEHQERLIKDAEKLAQAQAEERAKAKAEPRKAFGFVTVAAGEGFAEIFRGLGADYVIEGGQTMNPSTEDVINAIDKVNADNVFLYPNNKNIIMAANQARELVQEKNIIVIPTKTVPQGVTAMLGFDPGASVEENQQMMLDALGTVQTAELTYAIRDTKIDDIEIHHGDIMAVGDNGILNVGTDIQEVAVEAVDKMMTDEAGLISIYFGKEYSEENANRMAQMISEKYPDLDVEVNDGGQPVYYCIISVE
ncbi:MAG: DAK2 domain-containing protein [Eubacteriales bacterium]|nr:DAK2 domain-containing protein [Eubacteriales bacterium]